MGQDGGVTHHPLLISRLIVITDPDLSHSWSHDTLQDMPRPRHAVSERQTEKLNGNYSILY